MRGLVEEALVLEQTAMQAQRTTRHPGVELLLRAESQVDVLERAAMLEPAVGHELEERGPAVVADMRDRLDHCGVDRLDQLAVVLRGLDTVAARELRDGPVCRLACAERRVDGIEVILTHEQHGQDRKSTPLNSSHLG